MIIMAIHIAEVSETQVDIRTVPNCRGATEMELDAGAQLDAILAGLFETAPDFPDSN